jgi:acetyl-CoA carboxylase biotin carboxyl carrier protein
MKMMNSLEAEFDCIIEDILVTNGELVEFDQDLFTVKKI